MTPKQANTLRGLKTSENKAWMSLTTAATTSTSAEAIAALGDNHAKVVAWNKAAAAVETYFATIRR